MVKAGLEDLAPDSRVQQVVGVKLRGDWLTVHPESSIRDFHEAFMSYGNTPTTLLCKILLGDAEDSRLFQ